MDTSRRAVESYWRSRMIEGVTSDEEKITAVYKLDEISELLRSSPSGIVKELSDFLLKRLDHKSPLVKQKALRVIKYSVGKSGPEFRREMQRNSVAVKNLLHYKGKPDPLKGDSLNKAVRETAQDALSAIFSTDDNKPAASEVTHKRMEGFGNTNYVRPSEEKKSFLSEVVDIGSASIKQGLTTLAQAHSQSFKKNDTGSYRGPTLNRSLTNESDHSDRYDKRSYHGGSQGSSSNARNATLGNWGQDSGTVRTETSNVDSGSSYGESKTREERFLETIVTSGGVRLQPTRDALQAFLMEATKMDALALCRALEAKLQSPHWQVRVKAVCVLEAILRKSDDEHFAIMASYFMDHIDLVIKCSESPQSSLREKANRVLSLLGGEQTGNASEKPTKSTVIEMPDLIDTGDNDLLGEAPEDKQNDEHGATKPLASSLLVDDLFGGGTISEQSNSELRIDDDPFADVSFHTSVNKDPGSDLFAGMTVGENSNTVEVGKSDSLDPFDIFGSSEPVQKQEIHTSDLNNLMAGLSVSGNGSMTSEKTAFSESIFSDSNSNLGSQGLNETVGGGFDPQKLTSPNASAVFPMGSIPYSIPPGMMYNQFYPVGPGNANAMFPMGGLLSQQQFMAAMANIQSLGSLNSHNMAGGNVAGTFGGSVSPIPDIFSANMSAQTPTVTMDVPKKEDTKAFDFISDHLNQARDSKRLI